MNSFVLRDASAADARAITAILKYYIANTTATFIVEPHTIEHRVAWFDQRTASHPAIAADVDGELVGRAPAVFQIIPGALNFVMSKR